MKNFLFILIFFIITSCGTSKKVFWCGDHACINKKEKEEYFKKTMIVEVREFNKKKEKISKIDKITNYQDKNNKKQMRLEEKQRLKDQKELAKQMRLEEKQRLKDQKVNAKEFKKKSKELRKTNNTTSNNSVVKINEGKNILKEKDISSTDFNTLVKKINERNKFKPYPNINDIPN